MPISAVDKETIAMDLGLKGKTALVTGASEGLVVDGSESVVT